MHDLLIALAFAGLMMAPAFAAIKSGTESPTESQYFPVRFK